MLPLVALLLAAPPAAEFRPPPGQVRVSWVGNSFPGDGGPNGRGFWVQNAADEIEVTPDGTVVAGIEWDEAGRCVGLHKGGRVNRELLKAPGKLGDTAWGWGTGNRAVAVAGDKLFVATFGRKLLRFGWTPGDLESARFEAAADLPGRAVGLAARGGDVWAVFPAGLIRYDAPTLQAAGGFYRPGAADVALAADGRLWLLAGGRVAPVRADGSPAGAELPDVGAPTAVSVSHADGRLVVCDDGPRQQVRFYDVSGPEPKLTRTFGRAGGLAAGTPGEAAPDKLFALRGAGVDAAGTLYVAMSFGRGPAGTLTLRAFAPAGGLQWELHNHAFVDTFGFDPSADGTRVYSRTHAYDLDLSKPAGQEATVRAVTLDAVKHPRDHRLGFGTTATVRTLGGRRLMYQIGQYAGGYRLYTFTGETAAEVDRIEANDKWAWDVAANGDIWHGDADGRRIRRYRFGGWTPDGKPRFDWAKPDEWPWPDGWQLVRRVVYDDRTDSLYLFGYLAGQGIDSWGVVGKTARRYTGWAAGKPALAWTKELPLTPDGEGPGKPLSAESAAVAGDFLFVGMCKPEAGRQYVHVYRLADAGYVGSLWPQAPAGQGAGWLDMPYAVQAMRRADGEYLVLVEEDWRGKNLLYRWRPTE
jgi:hypothetical protein